MESDQTSIHASSSSLQRNRPLHGRTGGPTRRSSKGQWTTEEDEILRMAVQRHKGKNWKRIAQCFKDRTDVQCLHRWQKVINPDLVKGPWSKKEDETIIELVNKYGPKKWSTISQHLPGRIGKQCRERWHNHLNPNINKEAWTQDEELMLIRAHQIYGNKWAELTRFLPGRTDNAIKNHWNSSVKKKVNMYLASGLLSHFPGMPPVGYLNPSAASSSSQAHQFSEGDNIVKGGSEVEEASLSGKSRTIATEHCCETEGSSSNPFPEDYCPTFQDATCSMSDVPHEQQGDKFLEDNSSLGWGTFGGKGWQLNLNMQPDISLHDLGQETPGMFWSSFGCQESHQAVPIPQESSITLVALGADNVNLITGPDGRLLYLVANPAEYCPSENVAHDHMDYLSLPFEIPEDGTFDAQCYSMPSEMLGDSFTQPVSGAGQLPQPDGLLVFSPKPNQHSNLQENADPEPVPECINDNVVISKESDCSPCQDYDSIEVQDLPKLVPANDFVSAPFNNPQSSSKEKDFEIDESMESEPVSLLKGCPRFPSLDIPAFTSDWHEDYSPLGIRKLMISTIAPFKPWDSPSRVKSPGGALKTAKTFTGSILRKRHRDLVSPLSEIRGEKKVEVGLEEGFFSNLANDFSRLEVMFDECVDKKGPPQSSSPNQKNAEGSFMDKENMNPACGQTEKQGHESTAISEINMSQKEELNGNKLSSPPTEATAVKINGVANGAYDTVKEFSGGLVEHDMNDMLFFSPGRFGGIKIDQAVNLSTKAFAIHHGALLSSSESCLSVLCSPRLSAKKDGANMVITTTSLPSPSNVENPGKSVATENNNNSIFMESPLERSIESPSTWKSPWFINTFAVDTDITIEDIGYFLSPGDQSYDAIGLMKQLGDQTIERFTDDTQEVLGGETQQSVMQENNGNPWGFHRTQHQTATTTLARERRTLDFSECGTTTAATPEKGKGSGMVFSGPTSFLLKRCR